MINIFFSHLAVERKVSSFIQNQALNALVFVYRQVLDKTIGEEELNADKEWAWFWLFPSKSPWR